MEQFFLASIDRYSKYPTVEIVRNASSTKPIKVLVTYMCITTDYPEQLDYIKLEV